ncbi:MAG: protein-export chaperone SecB [Alphaproteobacteria bacterium]|nr:protein-export chaperone SecB [Alphaproteobacteria bacterium]
MSDTPENTPNTPTPGANQPDEQPSGQPSFIVLAQYLKDLSFESPHAPNSFNNQQSPQLDVNVDVQGRGLAPDQYEVELSVTARANRDNQAIFVVEASYAGVFEIKNLPREQIEMVMLVECPRLLFPFIRQIVADATRNGNFPPLMMEPIDFLAIYAANASKANQQPNGSAVSPENGQA